MTSSDSVLDTSENDRDWFATRPTRRYRLRPMLPREQLTHHATHVLVCQLFPGCRLRTAMRWLGNLPRDCDDDYQQIVDLLQRDRVACVHDGQVCAFSDFPSARHG
jgi:hypothetical protein